MMKLRNLSALSMVASFMVTGPSTAYELTSLGLDGGWKDQPVSIVLDQSDYTNDILDVNEVDYALQSAFDTWADADENDKLSFNRLADGQGNYDVFDGLGASLDQSADWTYANITIGGWLDAAYFESLSQGGANSILAVSVTSKLRGGGSRKPKWTSDVFFNDNFQWSNDPNTGEFDIETVALHEIGHSIGFDHEDDVPSVMAAFYDGVNRSLFGDDLAGLAALYGGGGGGGKGNNGRGGGKGPNRVEIDTDVFITGVTIVDGFSADFSTVVVPEPNTMLLALLAFCGALFTQRMQTDSRKASQNLPPRSMSK